MEPIGAAASLLTLIEATAVIGKAAVKLHHDLRDAPQDIARIAERILVARSRLEAQLRYHKEHCSVSERDGVKLVNYQGLAALEMSLQNASSCLEELNGAHTLRSQKLTKSQCLRWILRERRPVLKLMQHLQDVEDGLSKLQITISLSVFSSTCVPVTPLLTSLRSISAASYSAIKDVAVQQSAFLDEVRRKKNFEMALPETEPQTGNQSIVASASWDYSLSTCHEDRYLTAKPKVWGRLANNENSWTLSSFVLTNTHWNLLSSAYSVTSLLRLPYFFSDRAISIQAQLQCFQLSWPSISHSVTLKNIVSQNLRFMRACRAGTVGEVRKLAMSRQGSPTDIDEFGTPALHNAIKSGSLELVRFLLDNGAGANDLDTRGHRSPLEIACRWGLLEIGRLLLARGASIEHIDSSGCTALTMLWFNMNLSFSRTEYAKALLALSSLPLSLERQESLSPLACVAMRGSAEDVKALLDLGANVHELDASGNRIMKYCIIGSNLRTYDCLIPYMPPGWIYEVDSRGRSHLHLALEFPGSNTKDIAERLLKAGADVHAVDASGILPEHLAKTTDESANRFRVWREGECGNLSAYLQALASCGFDVVMDDEGDFHWSSEPPLS